MSPPAAAADVAAVAAAAAGACISGSREAQRIVDWVTGTVPKKKLHKVIKP